MQGIAPKNTQKEWNEDLKTETSGITAVVFMEAKWRNECLCFWQFYSSD